MHSEPHNAYSANARRAGVSGAAASDGARDARAAAGLRIFCSDLRDLIGDDAYRQWGMLQLGPADDDRVVLMASNASARDHLLNRLGLTRLSAMWSKADAGRRELAIEAADGELGGAEPLDVAADAAPVTVAPISRRRFENFVVGDANRSAHAAARQVCGEDPGGCQLLYLYGPYGVGKTHLECAIDAAVKEGDTDLTSLYISSDRFRAEFVGSLKSDSAMAFKQRVRDVDILLIDDIHVLAGAPSTQTEAFLTIKDVLGRPNGRVVVAADRPVDELTELDKRLRSLLSGAAQCRLERPDLPLRKRILEQMVANNPAARAEGAVPTEVLDQIASAITTTPRELEGALTTVLSRTKLIGRPLTRETAAEALADQLSGPARRITVEEIQKAVAGYHALTPADLLSRSRARDIVRPRQQAMYLCREITNRSFPDLARRFGNRDHTTVLHACRRIAELCAADPSVRAEIEELRRHLRHQTKASAE